MCNNIIAKHPTTPQVCRYTILWNVSDQWRDQWNAATVCPTQWRSPALAGWLSWIVDVDRPSTGGHPKQRNRLDSSPGYLGATRQARWTWRSHAAGTSVCSSSSREPRLTALPLLGIFPKILGIWGSTYDLGILPCNLGIFFTVVNEIN